MALDNEVANDIEQDMLRPDRVLALLPAGRHNLEGADIEDAI